MSERLNLSRLIQFYYDLQSKNRLSKIEKKLLERLESELNNNKQKIEKEDIDLSKHKPSSVQNFLSSFSSTGLKFITHDFDVASQIFEFSKVNNTCKVYFEEEQEKYKEFIPAKLSARIWKFAFDVKKEGYWLFKDQKFNLRWHHKDVKDWCKSNPGSHPILNPRFEKSFILPFKKSIELKTPELKELVLEVAAKKFKENYNEYNIVQVETEYANFKTDVEKLYKGLSNIFEAIKQRSNNSKDILVEYKREGRRRYVIVTHKNSKSTHQISSEIIKHGDLSSAMLNFYQICDWVIKGTYRGQGQMYWALSNIHDAREDDFILNYPIRGFTHILRF